MVQPPTSPAARRAARAGARDQQRRRSEQRARLLEAAARVFARGYAKASVAAIVKEAGMSRRTFYEHFEDLSDALVKLYDNAASVLYHTVEQAYRAEREPIQGIEKAVQAYRDTVAANAEVARVVYNEIRAVGPSHALRHQATLARFASLISDSAANAHARGRLARAPDELTAYALVAGIEAACARHVYWGREDQLAEMAPSIVALILQILR